MHMKTRRYMRRSLRNFITVLLIILAFCSGFFGHTLLNARAEEKQEPQLHRYYTSIQIRQGDSLWDLAEQYRQGSGYSSQEYIDEIKHMNGLKSENLHSGEYLTVLYFAE